jgi:hypothetical protein
MPSYRATASKAGTRGNADFFASHEFEAPDTVAAMAAADAWFASKSVVSSEPTHIHLYAGRVLLCERTSPDGAWEKVSRT